MGTPLQSLAMQFWGGEHIPEAEMVKIMAEENNQWLTSPAAINQTIETVKKFIDGEIAKYATYEEFCLTADSQTKRVVASGKAFSTLKRAGGVGWKLILDFLGPNWSRFKVEQAINTLRADESGTIDREAVESFPTTEQAVAFKQAVKKRKVPKKDQKALAKKIMADEEKRSKRNIRAAVDEEVEAKEPEYQADIQIPRPHPN